MKLLPFAIFLLLFISCEKKEKFAKAEIKFSEIDSLHTNKEVEQFIGKTDDFYEYFTLKKVQDIQCPGCDSVLKNMAIKIRINKSYYKADFDNNGYTDLLVTGENKMSPTKISNGPVVFPMDFNAIVLMNFGKNKIKLYDISDGRFYGLVPNVEYSESQPFLVINTPEHYNPWKKFRTPARKSKLTFKFDDFIEYNPNPTDYQIEKIEYSSTGCFGECPVFTLNIDNDGSAKLVAKHYNYTKDWQKGKLLQGNYSTTLPNIELKYLTGLINYIDFVNLKNEYAVSWTDDITGILKITYNNGKIKIITYYGMQGTYGLKRLHDLLDDLKKNQDWK